MVALVPPEAHGDERGALLTFIETQRAALRRSVLGLTGEQAASRPTASELSLSGLLKHAARAELNWLRLAQQRAEKEQYVNDASGSDGFRLTGDETITSVLAHWDRTVKETEEFIRTVPSLDDTFPLPEAPWFPKDGRVSMRWMALHLVQEFGRHAGHADIIRESLDGRTSFELIAMEAGQEA
ncbi:DinB family protein [Streptomyces thermolilacinus]|uniref:DinB family protein n=1 Tax=Streptomyces thermolilacinus TaxID=285540 RepID=UPI003401CBCD